MQHTEEKLTFDRLPEVIGTLVNEVKELKTIITEGQKNANPEADLWFNVDQLFAYHPDKPARATVYDWVCLRRVPYHKDGKRLRFLKSEIDQWLKTGYHSTEDEIRDTAIDYINNQRENRR